MDSTQVTQQTFTRSFMSFGSKTLKVDMHSSFFDGLRKIAPV